MILKCGLAESDEDRCLMARLDAIPFGQGVVGSTFVGRTDAMPDQVSCSLPIGFMYSCRRSIACWSLTVGRFVSLAWNANILCARNTSQLYLRARVDILILFFSSSLAFLCLFLSFPFFFPEFVFLLTFSDPSENVISLRKKRMITCLVQYLIVQGIIFRLDSIRNQLYLFLVTH